MYIIYWLSSCAVHVTFTQVNNFYIYNLIVANFYSKDESRNLSEIRLTFILRNLKTVLNAQEAFNTRKSTLTRQDQTIPHIWS